MTALSPKLLSAPETVHPQLQSPLFRLPPELRLQIWSALSAAYDDVNCPYEPNSHYCRPGYTCAQRIETDFLRVCRSIYLEAYHLPLSVNEMIFYCYRGPRGDPDFEVNATADGVNAEGEDLDEDDTPWHFKRFRKSQDTPIQYIKTMHWFVQQYWLECDNFRYATESKEMSKVEKLTLTLRRGDFWNWEKNQRIGIDPRLPAAVTAFRMKETWLKEEGEGEGIVIPQHPQAFGAFIKNLPCLKVLVLELECEEEQQEELQAIVRHATKYWRFGHYDGGQMAACGEVGVERWIGPRCLSARRRYLDVAERPRLVKYSMKFRVA